MSSPARTLRRFGFRQTIKGALIIGILIGLMATIQGAGYNATYPDAKSRAQFAASLESAPSLGVLYGESKNLSSASGYVVYRVVPVMSLIAAIWGLATATRLLRGQEEDGHWEMITANNISARQVTLGVLAGFGASMLVAYLICLALTIIGGALPDVGLSFGASVLVATAIFLPAAAFASLGVLTSQLSFTRRRALLYGLVPLLVFFVMRAIGNTMEDFYWLKHFTPFGWSDLVSPVIDAQPIWLVPSLFVIPLFVGVGVYLAGKRDLGEGVIKEATSAKSRYFLLGSPTSQTVRQSIWPLFGWGASAIFLSGLMAAISGVAADSLADSPAAQAVVSQLGGADDLKIAVLGAGLIFIVIILLLMATGSMATIRKTEAKNYLDNLLVQPVRRTSWLTIRLVVIVISVLLISLLSGLATWYLAGLQDITLDLGNLLLISLALTGTVIFTLGLGTLVYGLLPRAAVVCMYVVIGWSFIIDALGSVIKLDDIVTKSSLFHYVTLSPTESPDWKTFVWLTLLGAAMAIAGIVAFAKRDIIAE